MDRRSLLKKGSAIAVGTSFLSGCLGSSSPDEATFEVDYSGEWSGAVGAGGSTKSISGRGRQVYTITDPTIVSGNAQKRDGGGGTLTVRIAANGDVVEQTSTNSQYGVAQVSHSF